MSERKPIPGIEDVEYGFEVSGNLFLYQGLDFLCFSRSERAAFADFAIALRDGKLDEPQSPKDTLRTMAGKFCRRDGIAATLNTISGNEAVEKLLVEVWNKALEAAKS